MTTENEKPETLIDAEAIGVEVSWSFGHGDAEAVCIDRAAVMAAFSEHGFPGFVEQPDDEDAMRRAARYAHQDKALVVRPLARPNRDRAGGRPPIAFGVYERIDRDGERGDGWQCGARVRLENSRAVALPPEGAADFIGRCKAVAEAMAETANLVMHACTNVDLSNALTNVGAAHLLWVSRRRNSGGVYFIRSDDGGTRARAERFVALLRALDLLSRTMLDGAEADRGHRFHPQIQEVYPKPLTMASWAESARADVEADLRGLLGDLEEMRAEGKMRDGTKTKRAEEADALIRKAEHLRLFLGGAVEQLTSQLSGIRDEFREAVEAGAAEAAAALAGVQEAPEAVPAEAPEPAPSAELVTPVRGRRRIAAKDQTLFDLE